MLAHAPPSRPRRCPCSRRTVEEPHTGAAMVATYTYVVVWQIWAPPVGGMPPDRGWIVGNGLRPGLRATAGQKRRRLGAHQSVLRRGGRPRLAGPDTNHCEDTAQAHGLCAAAPIPGSPVDSITHCWLWRRGWSRHRYPAPER